MFFVLYLNAIAKDRFPRSISQYQDSETMLPRYAV